MATQKNILIIDDDELVRTIVVKKLVEKGYAVDDVSNGRLGVEKVQSKKYDLIILDVLMPLLDGNEFMKQYDELNLGKTPVVVLTNQNPIVAHPAIKEIIIKSNIKLEDVVQKIQKYV